MILSIENLHAYYGDSHVLQGVDLTVPRGEIVCLLGRNGMGKTTLMRSIMGVTRIGQGRIRFNDTDITGLSPNRIARLGISFVPEDRGIFPDLSLKDNLFLGTLIRRRRDNTISETVFEYFPILRERLGQKGGSLSGGEQQMLAIARGLLGEPDLLLLDEFSEGIQPSMIRRITSALEEINRAGVSVLIVEQNAKLALNLASYGYIMSKGRITYAGPTAELRENAQVLQEHLVM